MKKNQIKEQREKEIEGVILEEEMEKVNGGSAIPLPPLMQRDTCEEKK